MQRTCLSPQLQPQLRCGRNPATWLDVGLFPGENDLHLLLFATQDLHWTEVSQGAKPPVRFEGLGVACASAVESDPLAQEDSNCGDEFIYRLRTTT